MFQTRRKRTLELCSSLMGRSSKVVSDTDGIDRRDTGYYSTPEFVSTFLAREMRRVNPRGTRALDPCVGKEELIGELSSYGVEIDGFDVIDFGHHRAARFSKQDFLAYFRDHVFAGRDFLPYDYFIANPPYNCHEADYIRANKSWLAAIFEDVGVANMYSMFISAMIELAKPGAVIGLVTLDSFLTAGSHEGLRRKILDRCTVHNLHLCPSDLFRSQKADVRTCLLVLEKGRTRSPAVTISNRPPDAASFRKILEERTVEQVPRELLFLDSDDDKAEFVVGCPADVRALFNHRRLGQLFPCVTGISTGNDREFIAREQSDDFPVPFYKNPATRRFFTEPDGFLPRDFLEIASKIPTFMVRNKELLFREGITCSSMGVPFGAARLPPGSTYGVNANIFPPLKDIPWLLAYLNSSLVTFLVRGVLIRSNMITSGYVSRIPVVPITDEARASLRCIAENMMTTKPTELQVCEALRDIDEVVFEEANLAPTSRNIIKRFAADILKLT